MAYLLITGSSGFIGTSLCVWLQASSKGRYAGIVGIDLVDPQTDTGEWLHFYKGDITDSDLVDSIFESHNITAIVHLAALASVPRSIRNPLPYFQTNVTGTAVLLQKAATHKCRFIYASSSSVYGNQGTLLSPYALTKKFNDMQNEMWHRLYGVECIGLTFFNVIGPWQKNLGALVPAVVHAAVTKEPVTIFGDGTHSRSFAFVNDVCRAIMCAVRTSDARAFGTTLDVGGREVTTVSGIVDKLRAISGRPITVTHCEERPGDIKRSAAGLQTARDLLQWEPIVDIDAALAAIWDHAEP